MDKKVKIYCSTTLGDDDPVRTVLTLDYSDLTDNEVRSYADDSCVIKWRATITRKKDAVVPAVATYKVPKPGTRAVTEMSEDEMLAKLLAQHDGNIGEVLKALAAKAGLELPTEDEDNDEDE